MNYLKGNSSKINIIILNLTEWIVYKNYFNSIKYTPQFLILIYNQLLIIFRDIF